MTIKEKHNITQHYPLKLIIEISGGVVEADCKAVMTLYNVGGEAKQNYKQPVTLTTGQVSALQSWLDDKISTFETVQELTLYIPPPSIE